MLRFIAARDVRELARAAKEWMLERMRAPWWTQTLQHSPSDYTVQVHDGREGFFVLVGDREYYLVSIERPPSQQALVVTLRSHLKGSADELVHKLDLLTADACDVFVNAVIDQFARSGAGPDLDVLRRDFRIVRFEAKLWRDTLAQASLRSSRSVAQG